MKSWYCVIAFATAAWLVAAGCGGKKSEQYEKEFIVVSEEEMSDLDLPRLGHEYDEPPVIVK